MSGFDIRNLTDETVQCAVSKWGEDGSEAWFVLPKEWNVPGASTWNRHNWQVVMFTNADGTKRSAAYLKPSNPRLLISFTGFGPTAGVIVGGDNQNQGGGVNQSGGDQNSQNKDVISDGSYYQLINTATNTYLDVNAITGYTVQGYQNNGGYLNQKWIAMKRGGNWLFKNGRTGTYLTPNGTTASSNVIVSNSEETLWTLIPRDLSRNHFTLALASGKQTNPPLVLDLKQSNPANETPVIIYPSYGTANQTWQFVLTTKGTLS